MIMDLDFWTLSIFETPLEHAHGFGFLDILYPPPLNTPQYIALGLG